MVPLASLRGKDSTAVLGGDGGIGMVMMAVAEIRNETASRIMAIGAVTAAISSPPIAGPAIPAVDCVVESSELAWTY